MDLWPRWDLNPLFWFSHYKYFLSLNSLQIFPLFKYYHLLLTIVDAILYMKFILGRPSWLECWRVIAGHRVGSNWLCSTVPRTISGVSHQGAVRQTWSSKGEGHLKMRWPFAFPQAHYKDPFLKHHLNNDPLIHDHLDKDPLIYDHLDKDPLVDVHFDKDPSVKKLSVEPLQARVKFAWRWSGRLLPSTPSKFTGIF